MFIESVVTMSMSAIRYDERTCAMVNHARGYNYDMHGMSAARGQGCLVPVTCRSAYAPRCYWHAIGWPCSGQCNWGAGACASPGASSLRKCPRPSSHGAKRRQGAGAIWPPRGFDAQATPGLAPEPGKSASLVVRGVALYRFGLLSWVCPALA